jgi:hypothetical protein
MLTYLRLQIPYYFGLAGSWSFPLTTRKALVIEFAAPRLSGYNDVKYVGSKLTDSGKFGILNGNGRIWISFWNGKRALFK